MKHSRTRILITAAVLLLLLFGIVNQAQGGPIFMRWTDASGDQRRTFDLTNPDVREEFRAIFGHIPRVKNCLQRADYATQLFHRRNRGETEEAHLAEVRGLYEKTKGQPEGAVAWYVYVDFQRMVRDLHRRNSERAGGGYVISKPLIAWDHEFRFCFQR